MKIPGESAIQVLDKIDQAMHLISRRSFLPADARDLADFDTAIAIGYGQTNSQPTVVRRMLEWLSPEPGDKVLDVGSGSGWTSALLGYLVGKHGRVFAVERIEQLMEFGRDNVRQAGIDNVKFFTSGDHLGLPEQAPFDRILVGAAASGIPPELIDQLVPGGRIVLPINNDIVVATRSTGGEPKIVDRHHGYVFVPLI